MDTILQIVKEWEWLLLLAVAILETFILFNIFREKREREKLIAEMQTTRVELGRESYLTMMKGALENTNRYVYFISHTLTSTMSETQKDNIFKLYKKGIDHRCITGNDPGKIKFMWEQKRRGVQVRVNNLVMWSTFRFQVFDDRIAVLGFAEEGDEESRRGILITNPFFCRMLKEHFITTWEDSQHMDDYIREIVSNIAGPELGSSLIDLAQEWALCDEEKEELKEILNGSIQTSTRKHLLDFFIRKINSASKKRHFKWYFLRFTLFALVLLMIHKVRMKDERK
jgi:hypothetical protein